MLRFGCPLAGGARHLRLLLLFRTSTAHRCALGRRRVPRGSSAAIRGLSAFAAAFVLLSSSVTSAPAQERTGGEWVAVEEAIGRKGTSQPGNVMRFSFPRLDLQVTVRGVRLRPAFALGSWVAFRATREGALAMGDLVLREGEVSAVIAALQNAGIEQSALHHHLLHESPRLLYLHIHAQGDAAEIAKGIRAALARTGTPRGAAAPRARAAPIALDTTRIDEILGQAGTSTGGVYQVLALRTESIRDHGVEIPPAMGVATTLNFQPTGGGRAAITGDFVLTAREVNAVIRALGAHRIEVTSLHNHLLTEEPRLFFLHFWGTGNALDLARGLREALDRTNVRR
jgi:hypothetical protein